MANRLVTKFPRIRSTVLHHRNDLGVPGSLVAPAARTRRPAHRGRHSAAVPHLVDHAQGSKADKFGEHDFNKFRLK